jgi:hypothetical protein
MRLKRHELSCVSLQSQDAQDKFCSRLDQHETALIHVAQLTASKMSARLANTKKKAAILVHHTREQGAAGC